MIKLFNQFALFLFDNPGAYMLYYTVVFAGGFYGTIKLLQWVMN